ncbi:hypothetical protein CYLTODRAFT_354693 [Cylindrobasidium torrendii FP15055 ss-10]|uniref:Uncharacterized protein n=1 Tax=Cylindrobasidium torrendii FP15055 ss-10 TaxID=1314674 RepID=A0A0D7B7V4_9AGAR|nr:hypothetical protein CYLTODRAFT_354693 [Cylindrobasidium torrendii FP15055 ss-10]
MDVSLDSIRFAFWKDRFAVSLPSSGVSIYLWQKGTYQKARPIVKKNVTCIKFMDEGSMLVGGTKDGSLWQCGVPNGILSALTNVKAVINDVSVDREEGRALVARYGGMCELVNLRHPRRGMSVMTFGNEDTIVRPAGGFGCKFLAGGQGALFGNVSGCALVWDTVKGSLVYGLSHEEGVMLILLWQAHDGTSASDVGYVVTATKRGSLYWWPQPASGMCLSYAWLHC